MTEAEYETVSDVLDDADSTTANCLEVHTRYVEEAFKLPRQRSEVFAMIQFGFTIGQITTSLDIGERMVRRHWELLHENGAAPLRYRDMFGLTILPNGRTPPLKDGPSGDALWAWPWQHRTTVRYEDANGFPRRISIYNDVYQSMPWTGSADYLAVWEGVEEDGRVWGTKHSSHGESLMKYLTMNAETDEQFEARSTAMEFTRGDANGIADPDTAVGSSWEELTKPEMTVVKDNEMGLDTPENITAQTTGVDTDYLQAVDYDYRELPMEVVRTETGIELRS